MSSKLAPHQRDGRTKDVVQVLIASMYNYFRIHAYDSYWLGYSLIYLCCPLLPLLHGLSQSYHARTSIPMPTMVLALLLNSFALAVTITTTVLLLLLLSNYCCNYIAITTNKLCQARYFSGAAELTTQFLRLINILWFPLCRINKLGYIFPRRLSLVGHQAPLVCHLSHLSALTLLGTRSTNPYL